MVPIVTALVMRGSLGRGPGRGVQGFAALRDARSGRGGSGPLGGRQNNNSVAIVKYARIPVTSTNVATNGLDARAGSAPTLLKTRGSIGPINVPHRQMNDTERAITSPNRQRPTVSVCVSVPAGNVYTISPSATFWSGGWLP